MSAFAAPALPADVAQPTGFLQTLLSISLTAVAVLRPFYADDGQTIRDFAWVYLNEAGQQLLGQPERPAGSLLMLLPGMRQPESFAVYCQAFLTGEPRRCQTAYQADGLAGYLLVATQRYEDLLVVSFTNDQPRAAADQALRESQAREQERTQQLREAQAAVERERAQLHALLTQAPVAIGLFAGDELRVSTINPLMANVLGYSPDQLLGRPLFEQAPELQGQGFDELMRQVQATQVPFVGREVAATVQRHGEAQRVYFNFVYQPLYDEEGRVTGIINVAVDVTEQVVARQQLEQLNQELEARVQARTRELAEQQGLLSQILGQVPAAIATLSGPTHRFTFFNEAYQQMNNQRTVLGATLAEVVPEAAEHGFGALLDEVYRTGQPYVGSEVAVRLRQADGPSAPYYVDFRYQPLHDEAGQVRGVLIFAIDVTEQVMLRQQQQVQAQRLRHVFAQAPVAIFVVRGTDYVLDIVNESMGQMLNLAPDYMLGKRYFDLLPGLEAQGYRQLLDQVWHTGREYIAQEQPAQLPHHGAGETGYYNFVYTPLHEADGRITGITCVALDVTAQVLMRQQVQVLNDELHVSNRQLTRTNVDLDTFVYTASHDLKAPIANIEGLLSALQHQLPAAVQQNETIYQLLTLMQGAVERFRLTIDQLTDVSRLQQAQNLPAEQVRLAPLVEDVRLDLAPQLAQAGAVLTIDIAPDVQVEFAPKNLRSVVYNLLSNALKYRHPGRVPQVTLRAVEAGECVELTVQDNGLGLSEYQQQRLFGLFQRLHTHVEGTGVGLYMVKRMVENAGGTIAVESQVDVGTCFIVELCR